MVDPDYTINENILNNYLKALKSDERTIQNIKERVKDKGDVLVDKAIEQNNKVLYYSSKVYESMLDHFENSNNELANLDSLLDEIIEKMKSASFSGEGGDSNKILNATMKEFDIKVDEMKALMKSNDEKIQKEKKYIADTNDKIKDVNEYIHKFTLEKKLYLDKVSEDELINLSKLIFLLYKLILGVYLSHIKFRL